MLGENDYLLKEMNHAFWRGFVIGAFYGAAVMAILPVVLEVLRGVP